MHVIKKKKWILVLMLILLVVSIFAWRSKQEVPESKLFGQWQSPDKSEESGLVQSEEVTIIDSEKLQKVNLMTSEMRPAEDEQYDLSAFSGLPQLGIKDKTYLEKSNLLISAQKNLLILEIATYNINGEQAEFVDPDAIIEVHDYLCNIEDKKCEIADIFSQQYVGLDDSIKKSPFFVWDAFDSVKNLLFGRVLSNGTENASPVYICNIEQKKCDQIKVDDVGAIYTAPFGSFSFKLDKVAVVVKKQNAGLESWELAIYKVDNLTSPFAKYDISSIFSNDEESAHDGVQSLAWNEGKHLAIGTAQQIFTLETEKGNLSLAYIAPLDEDGDYNWDFSSLRLSSDARFLYFIDSSEVVDELDEETQEETLNILQKVDLEKKQISSIYSGRGLMME